MIEIEKKFALNNEDEERLTKDAQFLNEYIFTDIYYDTDDFSLTSKDKWFRSRDGKFELKIPLSHNTKRLTDQYDELKDEKEIRKVLGLFAGASLTDDLAKGGYLPFCVCKTTRRKYKKEPFVIDIDVVDFRDFIYNVAEIELTVSDKTEIKMAVEKI